MQALAQSLTEILRRHEALRTTYAVVDGEPVQVISEQTLFPLEVVDLRSDSAPERAIELDRLVKAEEHRPFDLSEGPLIRGSLFQLDAGEHMLMLLMHHSVFDGWSLLIFERELWTLYEA